MSNDDLRFPTWKTIEGIDGQVGFDYGWLVEHAVDWHISSSGPVENAVVKLHYKSSEIMPMRKKTEKKAGSEQ